MARAVIIFVACLCLFAVLVQSNQRAQEASMQKVLEEHAHSVGLGLSGRLASGYKGLVGTKVFPPVHENLNGHVPCRHGGNC